MRNAVESMLTLSDQARQHMDAVQDLVHAIPSNQEIGGPTEWRLLAEIAYVRHNLALLEAAIIAHDLGVTVGMQAEVEII